MYEVGFTSSDKGFATLPYLTRKTAHVSVEADAATAEAFHINPIPSHSNVVSNPSAQLGWAFHRYSIFKHFSPGAGSPLPGLVPYLRCGSVFVHFKCITQDGKEMP